MRSVTTSDGRTLTVREGGDPDGFPVLSISGTPGSSTLYERHVRDAAERGIRLFSYDRPGYGGSTRQKDRNVADCAADIAAVCDALGVQRFCVWGISGGGPHALAAAALMPDRVIAAASLASVAPYDAEGLDFLEGMGEQNVEEMAAIFEGEDAHRASMEKARHELLSATPEQLVELWQTLLGPSDREVATGVLAAFLLDHMRAGIGSSGDGWIDDDRAFVTPWGFDLASIRVPVQLWQGEQDQFVPHGHGVWLAEHIPGVDARLTAEDGHLTLAERRVPEVHGWLMERAELRIDTAHA
ncbi:MAG TPA: alpha/beta fold hydrolase [Gaiellaceae bacterium]|jgi:pimeloyl-ACP methyl ester carboxylesterase